MTNKVTLGGKSSENNVIEEDKANEETKEGGIRRVKPNEEANGAGIRKDNDNEETKDVPQGKAKTGGKSDLPL